MKVTSRLRQFAGRRCATRKEEFSVACADFEQVRRRLFRENIFERARENSRVAHQGVDAPQIAAAADGFGMIGGKVIEEFGMECADHFPEWFNSFYARPHPGPLPRGRARNSVRAGPFWRAKDQ